MKSLQCVRNWGLWRKINYKILKDIKYSAGKFCLAHRFTFHYGNGPKNIPLRFHSFLCISFHHKQGDKATKTPGFTENDEQQREENRKYVTGEKRAIKQAGFKESVDEDWRCV